ncbi:MAG TPA: hypothetical protein VMI75_38040 [Polyangiaceae bacterium]|nr:hypothetical protein [Polyangiaceae bacterium]
MSARIAPILAASAVLGAAAFALLHGEDTRAETRVIAAPASEPADTATAGLPPGHPPIGGTSATHHGMQGSAQSDEPPALTWTVPAAWRAMPNPNALRVATYRVSADESDPTEVTVSRAGGSTEDNVQRWIAQFDHPAGETRTQRDVGGVSVTVVEVSGTYKGNGMMAPGRAPKVDGWTLVGAIAAPGGTPYFFKMTGPAARVRAARPAFDAMIASLTRP